MVYTVLRNLISNACKFTHRNGQITVEASLDGSNTHVEVVVTDTGVGISAINQENIFRIGHNVRSVGTGNEMGCGLGLILCNEFVAKNKGKIWMKSEENIWTKVFFSLPRSIIGKSVEETVSQRKYLLPDKQWQTISDSLIRLLVEDRIFKNQDITLKILSEKVKTNRVYLSQIINDMFNCNFNHLINDYRIKESLVLLENFKHLNLTIETVAEQSWFRNKSTFYTAFRKFTGKTPHEYLKE